jgi:acyl-coenzyme A synthetase/AMP-(fatty) acid ligase
VPAPDEIRGEEVRAFVQLVDGLDRDAAPPDVLLAHCRSRLAPFKIPRYLTYVAELPLTPSQRVEKHRLPRDPRGSYDAAAGAWI